MFKVTDIFTDPGHCYKGIFGKPLYCLRPWYRYMIQVEAYIMKILNNTCNGDNEELFSVDEGMRCTDRSL